MALKKHEEQLLKVLTNQAVRLSRFIPDPAAIREEMKDDILELEQSAQIILRFEFVDEQLNVIVEDRSQDSVRTFWNTNGEKLFLRAQLNNVPIDVMLFRKAKNDGEPILSLNNAAVAEALSELAMLVKSMRMSMVAAGNAKWSLVAGEAPSLQHESKSNDAKQEDGEPGDDIPVAQSTEAVDETTLSHAIPNAEEISLTLSNDVASETPRAELPSI